MVKQKNARVLMQETCWFCQKPLDYDKWIEGNPDEAFGIAYTQPFVKTWMPFYISKRSTTPTFDEDFTLYGYDRLIQVNSVKHDQILTSVARWYKCERLPKSNDFRQSAVGTTQMIKSGHMIACWKGQSVNYVGKIVSDLFQAPTHLGVVPKV